MAPTDVQLRIEDNALIVDGERRTERELEQGGIVRTERVYGRFQRVIPLPEGADSESAEARFANGVLEVTIKTPLRRKGRQIEIQGGERLASQLVSDKAPKTPNTDTRERSPMPVNRWRWWSIALRGVAALALGVISLFWPGLTFVSLVFVFAAYAIVDGVLALVLASKGVVQPRGWIVVRGLVSIAAGLIAFFVPGITAFALLVVIAAWAIVAGISEIVMAVKLRRMIKYEWLLGIEGGAVHRVRCAATAVTARGCDS